MKLNAFARQLHPRLQFRIARARRSEVINVFVTLESHGITGFGEASPNSFYDESAEGVLAKIAAASDYFSRLTIRSLEDIEKTWTEIWPIVAPSRAAQCALDIALWDWFARFSNTSVTQIAWGTQPIPINTFCTIGLSSPDELESKVRELVRFPFIKIKSDQLADLAPVRYIRDRSEAVLAIDANCAWGDVDLSSIIQQLRALDVAFVEQPHSPGAESDYHQIGVPIFADESCVSESDIEAVARVYDGFNIKLVKCGGITPGLRMCRRGRELGLKTMVGCMLESSVLIAAGAVIAQKTDYADLDGAWLLKDDPFRGWRFVEGVLHPPPLPGLGIAPIRPLE